MEEKVCKFIQEYHMVEKGDRIAAGISGGGDSMALLFLLSKLREKVDFELCAVHVNHGIRGAEAKLDEELVREYCQEKGIFCRIFTYPVPEIARQNRWSLEEAGREMRRAAYGRTLEEWGGNKIALAHHQNDQAETMIHHLARGCGLRGIRGMLPIQGKVIRPFLCIDRREIDYYLKENGIPYRTDSTNLSDQYVRNKIRRHVVGYLEEEINKKAVAHMAAEIEEYMSAQGRRILEKHAEITPAEIRLPDSWTAEAHILQVYGLLQAVECLCGQRKDLSSERVGQILELFQKETGKRVEAQGGITAWRVYDGLILRKTDKRNVEDQGKEWILPVPGSIQCGKAVWSARVFPYEFQKIPEKTYTKWFDYDKIKKTLHIRGRRPGDRIAVMIQGGRKKLKDYLIDEKIPQSQRDSLSLLAQEDDILWVVGRRISEAYKITEFTKRVLEVKYQGGRESE